MQLKRVLSGVVVCLLAAAPVLAQGNPTGSIAGQIRSEAGSGLPGVTVTVSSPVLQGARSAVTSEHGDYLLPFLPPGEYRVVYDLDGFRRESRAARVAAAQTVAIHLTMQVAGEDTVTVVAAPSDLIPQTATAVTTLPQSTIETLPVTRALDATVALAAGVFRTGPVSRTTGLGALSLSGATSFENLFLLNGVVVNENLRGQPISLFIEDAIQETSVSTSGLSAEFGRFSGGVVNALTKSGGNRLHGSFRTTFTNDDWRAVTPFGESKVDNVIPAYEYTLGGPIVRDKLWFFGAGRFVERSESRQTAPATAMPYVFSQRESRYEGKATYALNPRHTFKGAYLYRLTETENDTAFSILDLASLSNPRQEESLTSLNYTGVLSNTFFLEGQYSRREGTIEGTGSAFTDQIRGTLIVDQQRGNARFNSPTFCGVCSPEQRDNENVLLKGTWFLSTQDLGSHAVVAGYDTFNDIRLANNHQSGSGYRVLATTSVIRDGVIYPVFNNDGQTTRIQYNPILQNSEGTDFRTHSLFVNDTWRLGARWTFNLGLRYDRHDGRDASGATVADAAAWSPRLAATWDPRGDGVWAVNASYASYVASLSNSIAGGGTTAGNAATFQYRYQGPAVNTSASAPLLTTEQALQTLFDWFFANGGTSRPAISASLPGVNTQVGGGLVSPGVDEIAGGVTRRLGDRGMARVDAVYRSWRDFYATRADTSTGQVQTAFGLFDLRLIENTNDVSREYAALNATATYRFGSRLVAGGAYTLSRTWGTFDGESDAAGPTPAGPVFYPEYVQASWNRPDGDLALDQRHKARIWANLTLPMAERVGALTLGVLQSLNSGAPYGAVGAIDSSRFVANPGYRTPPASVSYYFSDRDAFRADASAQTDLAVNYAYRLPGIGSTELFAKAEVLNVFDQAARSSASSAFIDQTVLTRSTSVAHAAFNPFAETPVEGTHWALGPSFGKPINRFAFQQPRTFRFAVGVRF
jgi:outer membrane receptor for ferrienterochelin and colicin